MRPMTTRNSSKSGASAVLYLSFESGERDWKLAFTMGLGQRPRHRTIRAGQLGVLDDEVGRARQRFGLATDAGAQLLGSRARGLLAAPRAARPRPAECRRRCVVDRSQSARPPGQIGPAR